jgi:competence protein ComFB
MTVTNALEEIVPATLDRLAVNRDHIRGCDACRSDVIALALTNLAPGYSSTEMGRIVKRIDIERASGQARVTVAVLTAISIVEQNPHHAA